MQAHRGPRIAPGRSVGLGAALVAVGLFGGVPAAQATNTELFPFNGNFFYGDYVHYGPTRPLSRVYMDNRTEPGFGLNNLSCAWAQNVDTTLPYPTAATVRYSESYWRTYGSYAPWYYNDYPGRPECAQHSKVYHNYNGDFPRRGINFKSGLQPTDQLSWGAFGSQEW